MSTIHRGGGEGGDHRLLKRPLHSGHQEVVHLFDGRTLDVRVDDRVGDEVEQLVDTVVPGRVPVREVGQLVDGRVHHAGPGRRTRFPEADHRVAGRQPLVRVGRVQPVRQAAREPPSQVRAGRYLTVERQPVDERPEHLVRHGRLLELDLRGRRRVLSPAAAAAESVAVGAVHAELVVVGRRVRRWRQRPVHVGREHLRDGRVHVVRII